MIKQGQKKHTKMTLTKREVKTGARKRAFLEAYEASACNVSRACKGIGISRNTFYEWRKSDPVFAMMAMEQEEAMLDFAESMLHEGIKAGKTAEIIFYLKTKGQKRGYIERQRLDVTSEVPDLSGMSIEELKLIAYGPDQG